jgi:hypothetical protein
VKAKKKKGGITLQEHIERISSLGGKARAEQLSAKELSAIGKKAGKVGGKARADSLTPARRKAIAKKAAMASAKVRSKNAADRKKGKSESGN